MVGRVRAVSGIDHTSPRDGKVMMVRVKKRNVWQVAYRFEGDTSSCSYRFSSLDVHVIDQRFNEYSPSRASHLRELDVCKLTSPYMTKNVAPVLQRQIVQCHRRNRISRDRSPISKTCELRSGLAEMTGPGGSISGQGSSRLS